MPHCLLGTVLGKDVETLQRQHHTDENTGHDDDGQGHHTNRIQLLDQQLKTAADAAAPDQGMNQEQAGAAEHGQDVDGRTAEQTNAFQ
ncbi:hypothetical protein D9M71_301370 [compost metagenome]